MRKYCRYIARLRMEQAGIKKPGKKMKTMWRDYAPIKRRKD